MAEKSETPKPGAAQTRGTSYPFIDLQEAVTRARKFYDEEGKAPAAVAAAVKHWGYSDKSSGGRQTVSTLLQYGLFRFDGASDQRRIWLSKLALDILLLEQGSAAQMEALKTAARSPKLYADILSHYATTAIPSDASLKHFLVTQRDISTASVDAVIKHFRATMRYANLSSSDKIQDDDVKVDKKPPKPPEVGDLVQWQPGGVLQFTEARRVRAIQDHEGSKWVFVDGSDTGMPIAEVTVEQIGQTPPANTKQPPVFPEIKLPSESEWLKGRLSKGGVTFRLLGTGELGPNEIDGLIKLLQAQQEILK
jgi:hypothetical protein